MNIKATQEDINNLQEVFKESVEQIEHYNNNPVLLPNLPNFKTPKVPQYNKEILEQIKSLNGEVEELKKKVNKKDWTKMVLFVISILSFIIATLSYFDIDLISLIQGLLT